MKTFIIANWKCNPVFSAEAERLFNTVEKGMKRMSASRRNENVEVVICSPFVYLWKLSSSKFESLALKLRLGAQDCHWEQEGAFTGEVSPIMLKNLGCDYVIVGHSERRKHFSEINEMVNKKLLAAFKVRLKPILCIGEKDGEEMSLVVKNQLVESLKDITRTQMRNLIIAYEPIWAIGSGNPCKPDDAMKAALFIRKTLSELYNRKLAEEIPILYGGSVNSKIAVDYIKGAGMNGLLIGGASLDGTEFVKIVKQANNV
ncbi:MAG: triose-phosphate isomerase [Candidatus Omnitrophica bacterium]|nr:triose-phosphate isomerase [Candidatus Omnitrophota bacterium]